MLITASHAEKQNVNLKMEIKAMKEEIERIQSTHSRHLKEKNEMWTICSVSYHPQYIDVSIADVEYHSNTVVYCSVTVFPSRVL